MTRQVFRLGVFDPVDDSKPVLLVGPPIPDDANGRRKMARLRNAFAHGATQDASIVSWVGFFPVASNAILEARKMASAADCIASRTGPSANRA